MDDLGVAVPFSSKGGSGSAFSFPFGDAILKGPKEISQWSRCCRENCSEGRASLIVPYPADLDVY